jgi:cell division ATPase FtsA
VAIKSDVVEGLFRTAEKAGLRLQLVDVSPAALCNAFRYNYGDLEGCTMLLDIGARTSNLLFFEKGNIYSRGISIGAHSITQDFAKESKLGYDEAERLKIEEGFVSLGGAYEEPENAHQAAISKIARQVLTRLHMQVNQTIQFYRGQQSGSPPDRLFLSGGATSMPYTAQFFSEKLNLPVEYFNPLRNLQIDEQLPREDLAKVAHSLGEVVGLGLRNLAHCPVELNLMPKSSLKRREFNQKKPYLVASVFCLILMVFAYAWFYGQVADEKQKALSQLQPDVENIKRDDQKLKTAMGELRRGQNEADQLFAWMEDRYYWAGVLTVLRESLIAVEDRKEKEIGAKTGVWIEKLEPVVPPGYLTVSGDKTLPGGRQEVRQETPTTPTTPTKKRTSAASSGSTNQIDTLLLTCRSVNLRQIKDDANTVLAESLAEELRSRTNYFNAEIANTKVTGDLVGGDSTNLTFTFQVTVKLVRPMKL